MAASLADDDDIRRNHGVIARALVVRGTGIHIGAVLAPAASGRAPTAQTAPCSSVASGRRQHRWKMRRRQCKTTTTRG
jgi:hypothetical protein